MKTTPDPQKRRYTWSDYRAWPGDERWEIIGGEAYGMSPAPSVWHQSVSIKLAARLESHFEGRQCVPFAAPVDLKLSDEDVVQPDLFVVCDRSTIRPTHVEGAPELVVEIISASTAVHDRRHKTALYARGGVKEVWLVTPYPPLVEVLVLDRGSYRLAAAYSEAETLTSAVFPDLQIALRGVFDFPIEPEDRVQLVKEGTPPYAARGQV